MGSLAKTLMALALLSASGVLAVAGCENTAGDCELTAECSGAPGTAAPRCDPNDATGVADTCGVFVSASAMPGGTGSRSSPFSTLAEALGAASKSEEKRVYACAETFAENVVVPAELTLYGGLDCANGWKLDEAARTTIASAIGIPIRFEAGKTTHVENVSALAPDGALPDPTSANPRSGGSSIAALAEPGATVELVRCDLEAGLGAPGANGETPTGMIDGPGGMNGDDACGDGGVGGVGGMKTCDGNPTNGGDGGSGGEVVGGLPGNEGLGPSGGKQGGAQTALDGCSTGGSGAIGEPGEAGKSGVPLKGLLGDDMKGIPGTDGKAGIRGSGGGGGGGGIKCVVGGRGAGGGGGGAGGCGGGPGTGGGAGGSSIALWAVGAAVSMTDGRLIAKDGGAGGKGGDGQKGGAGGSIGMAGAAGDVSVACNGGPGGNGGDGGPGGGGEGGSSVGAVWKGIPPQLAKTTLKVGSAGNGGAGGTAAPASATGANGSVCAQLDGEKGECAAP